MAAEMSSNLELVLGASEFALDRNDPDNPSFAMMDAFRAKGYNEVDTSSMEQDGRCEETIGRYVNREEDKLLVATKINPWNQYGYKRKRLVMNYRISCIRLRTSCIDILYLHTPDLTGTTTEEILKTCQELYEEEKFHELGLSNFPAWRVDFRFYPPMLPINMPLLLLSVCGIAFSVGAGLGVIVLLLIQLRTVLLNKTQIESWIVDKAIGRRKGKSITSFVYPYDLGYWKNFTQVIKLSLVAEGDGLSWPVRKGCTQYTFTIEQLEQKREKRQYAVVCQALSDFSGSRCSLSQGLTVLLCTPCIDPTIAVSEGDTIIVTRWRKHWVYGDKYLPQAEVKQGRRVRGWIPRKLLKVVVQSRVEEQVDQCQSKVLSTTGNHIERTKQSLSAAKKGGRLRDAVSSSVANKDGKKKKKKDHRKKQD